MIEYSLIFKRAAIACLTILLVASSSCKDTTTSITKLNDIVFPDSNISYDKQVQPLFNVGCAYGTCHYGATAQNKNLDLSSYSGVRANFGVVIPGDTANSRLIWSIEARPGSVPMPPTLPALSLNQVRGLKRWILEGARETP